MATNTGRNSITGASQPPSLRTWGKQLEGNKLSITGTRFTTTHWQTGGSTFTASTNLRLKSYLYLAITANTVKATTALRTVVLKANLPVPHGFKLPHN